jgi:hypothetical protein
VALAAQGIKAMWLKNYAKCRLIQGTFLKEEDLYNNIAINYLFRHYK